MSAYLRKRFPSDLRSISERSVEIEDEIFFLKFKQEVEAKAGREKKNVFTSSENSMGFGRIPFRRLKPKLSRPLDAQAIAERRQRLFDALRSSIDQLKT